MPLAGDLSFTAPLWVLLTLTRSAILYSIYAETIATHECVWLQVSGVCSVFKASE